mgnify:CR=1 FL=1
MSGQRGGRSSKTNKTNVSIEDILGETTRKISEVDGVRVKSIYVDALAEFKGDKELIGSILEKAFESIDLVKLANDFKKIKQKEKETSSEENSQS